MGKFILLVLFCLSSCNSDKSNKDKPASLTDTIKANKIPLVVSNDSIQDFKTLTNKKDLIGVWASDNKEPITVEINADSIYYTEHFESHKYQLKDDSIIISYPDFVFSAKVYFNKDTLVMESEDGKSKYYRFKE